MEEYNIKRKIGDGAQGVVYEVVHRVSKTSYAMKVICCTDQEQVNMALKEIKVLLQLRHPSIVSYVDFFLVFNSVKLRREFAAQSEGACASGELNDAQQREARVQQEEGSLLPCSLSNSELKPATAENPSNEATGKSQGGATRFVPTSLLSKNRQQAGAHWLGEEEIAVCLVMELCSNGDMQGLVRETRQEFMTTGTHSITEAQVLSWLEQAAAALQFIHEKGFLHRDLKPTNIFFDEYKNVKIGDFGLAATIGLGRNSAVGTPYYLAPERMLQQRYGGKVDIWGLGVVLLELLTLREQPLNSMLLENPKVVDTVIPQITKMGYSTKLATLLRDMLQRQPQGRPTPSSILHRLASMTATSPHPGMSATLFAGMSCPKLTEALCDVCEVEVACVMCSTCKAAFCAGCDRARHRHHSRQSHDRTNMSSILSSMNGAYSLPLSATPMQQQQKTLSFSQGPSPANTSDQTRASMQNIVVFPSSNPSHPRTLPCEREMSSRTFTRFQLALPGCSLSMSDFSMAQRVQGRHDGSVNNGAVAETVLRVPDDVPSLAQALQVVESMPHVRKILVAGNTTHTVPLVLTSRLPDSIKLVGESPPPMLEVADSPFALHCQSGRGSVENFILRHVGRFRSKLVKLDANLHQADSNTLTSAPVRKPSRPTAVSITGGEWRLHKCRISCVEGSGVTVGGSKHTSSSSTHGQSTSVTDARSLRRPQYPSLAGRSALAKVAEGDAEDGDAISMEPIITKCSFIDVTAAGIVLMEKSRGLYEGNTFSGCGFAAFLLKKDATPRIRANHITDGAEAGIFCQDASGLIEYNVIAQNAGCGIVAKGASSVPVIRKNRVLSNAQAGVFCCDGAAPFVSDNEIRQSGKAGVLVKTTAAPKITRNVIESGKEAGIYVFEKGAGIIEENRIRGNQNAGLLVTTGGNPHVIHNTITKNAYEGIWVCKRGGGTFCDNDLRGNTKGAKDIEVDTHVTWVGNVEE
ncbi:protein kinase, putative [Leishmania tarentolae]|uniref:non-specific serine/threonine protein kinase n=1 Tax=Leishmania tarentolae TaxID=5689 RepID=A0A640KN98_LEITA|nr:protein kinase, putative [Leishmania tarentolae]